MARRTSTSTAGSHTTSAPAAPVTPVAPGIAARLLAWWDEHGRKDLPWQADRTAYRVWVSEIMLQQTQVATVVGYYTAFMARFPNVATLAQAPIDEVLHHWTGLGYYARARNLHRAARIVHEQYGGVFPSAPEALAELPGIGRSTANAIHALAHGGRAAILDGNVKRVLARWRGLEGWPGERDVEARMWALAEALLPDARLADYTQAQMDLGATCCTRARPACGRCPLRDDCVALATGRTGALPAPRPKRAQPERSTTMWIVTRGDAVLLRRRAAEGLWGGLWSFPESEPGAGLPEDLGVGLGLGDGLGLGRGPGPSLGADLGPGLGAVAPEAWPEVTHTFTHFRLRVRPMRVRLPVAAAPDATHAPDGTADAGRVSEPNGAGATSDLLWYRPGVHQVGLTALVTRLLAQLDRPPRDTPSTPDLFERERSDP